MRKLAARAAAVSWGVSGDAKPCGRDGVFFFSFFFLIFSFLLRSPLSPHYVVRLLYIRTYIPLQLHLHSARSSRLGEWIICRYLQRVREVHAPPRSGYCTCRWECKNRPAMYLRMLITASQLLLSTGMICSLLTMHYIQQPPPPPLPAPSRPAERPSAGPAPVPSLLSG